MKNLSLLYRRNIFFLTAQKESVNLSLSRVEVPEITYTTNKKAHGCRERLAFLRGICLKFSGFRLY